MPPLTAKQNIDEKWGFVDEQDHWVIQPQFEDAMNFSENQLAAVKIDGHWGFIDPMFDKNKQYIIKPIFNFVAKPGFMLMGSEYRAFVREKNKEYSIDQNGAMISSISYTADGYELNGCHISQVEMKYGIMGNDGKWMIEPVVHTIIPFDHKNYPIPNTRNNKWFIVPKWDEKEISYCNLFLAFINGKKGIFDRNGQWQIEPVLDFIDDFNEGLAVVSVDKKHGFINKDAHWVIKPLFDYCRNFHEGLAVAAINKKYGFINKSSEWVIDPIFDGCDHFENGLAGIGQNNKSGIIDKNGKFVIPPEFDYINDLGNGLYLVGKRNIYCYKYGLINQYGIWVLPLEFDDISYFIKGIAKACINGKYGIINEQGAWVIEPAFDDIDFIYREALGKPSEADVNCFNPDLIGATQNGKSGFINRSGAWVIAPIYDFTHHFSYGIAKARLDGHDGYIDESGQWLTQDMADKIQADRKLMAPPAEKPMTFAESMKKRMADHVKDLTQEERDVAMQKMETFIQNILSSPKDRN